MAKIQTLNSQVIDKHFLDHIVIYVKSHEKCNYFYNCNSTFFSYGAK